MLIRKRCILFTPIRLPARRFFHHPENPSFHLSVLPFWLQAVFVLLLIAVSAQPVSAAQSITISTLIFGVETPGCTSAGDRQLVDIEAGMRIPGEEALRSVDGLYTNGIDQGYGEAPVPEYSTNAAAAALIPPSATPELTPLPAAPQPAPTTLSGVSIVLWVLLGGVIMVMLAVGFVLLLTMVRKRL